jgi:hypothetical protein
MPKLFMVQQNIDEVRAAYRRPGRPHGRRRKMNARDIENAAYNRAADLAKSYAEHWEREAAAAKHDGRSSKFPDALKAGHWRIIEKAIRGLALQGSGGISTTTDGDT